MKKWVQRYEIRYAHDITQKADGTFVTYEAYKQLQDRIEQQQSCIRSLLEFCRHRADCSYHHNARDCNCGYQQAITQTEAMLKGEGK